MGSSRRGGHGEIEVGTYSQGMRVGKGARWSADRSVAWELQSGRAVKEIDLAEAAAFAESLGIPVESAPVVKSARLGCPRDKAPPML